MKFKPVLNSIFLIGLCSLSFCIPSYKIDFEYAPNSLSFSAKQEIMYSNNTGTLLDEIVLHIYGNKKLTQMDIAHNDYANFKNGYIEPNFNIDSLDINNQTANYRIEGSDKTILSIKLDKALAQNETIIIKINYKGTLPYMEARYGKFDYISHFSYFYPILSVYNKNTGWSRNPYSLKGQAFYSDVADYDISITVPNEEVIAAPGKQSLISKNTTHKTEHYRAKNMRSFHFSSSSMFQKSSKIAKNGVILNTYYLPSMKNSSKYVLKYAEEALLYYEKNYGKYPYKSFTILPGNLVHAGEEFPGIILIAKNFYNDAPNALFGGLLYQYRLLETVIAHETGHQWWNVMVGNDQYSQPWLDEGLTEYSTMLYLENKYGKDTNLIHLPHVWASLKGSYKNTTQEFIRESTYQENIYNFANVVSQNIDQYYDISDYFNTIYSKGPMIVKMYHKMVGNKIFFQTMRNYLKKYYMKNSSINKFILIAEETSGKQLKKFFNQWLTSSEQCDYTIGKWQSKKNKYSYQNKIEIINLEKISAPVDIEISYENNQTQLFHINNTQNLNELVFKSNQAVQKINIDPENKIIERDELNNANFITEIDTNSFSLSSPPYDKYFIHYSAPYMLKMLVNPYSSINDGAKFNGLNLGKKDQFISFPAFPSLSSISYYRKHMDNKGSIFSYQLEKNNNQYSYSINAQKFIPIHVVEMDLEYIRLENLYTIGVNNFITNKYYSYFINLNPLPSILDLSYQKEKNSVDERYNISSIYYLTKSPVYKLGLIYKKEGTITANISGTGLVFDYNGYDDYISLTYIPVTQKSNSSTKQIYEIYFRKNLFITQFYNIKGEYINGNSLNQYLRLMHELSLKLYLSCFEGNIAFDNLKYILNQEYYIEAGYMYLESIIRFDIGFYNFPIIPFQVRYEHETQDFTYGLSLLF